MSIHELPSIVLTAADAERLRHLAEIGARLFPDAADFLAREVERAAIARADGLVGVVGMGSRVTFRDDVTQQIRTVTLVYPDAADVSAGRISVLTPIGAALIGLSEGQSIEWETPSGGRRSLTVLQVPDGRLAAAE